MKRTASAIWRGNLAEGAGTLSAPSGILEGTNYSFKTRFGEGVTGTNPEELLAASHAGCFSMALSHALSEAGFAPTSVDTTATVHLEQIPGGFEIPKIDLKCDAHVPGIAPAKFDEIAADAKANCPISKVLNAEISLDATLTV